MNETTELIMKQLNSKKVHAETHEVGGGDEIDVLKLKNINNFVTKSGDFAGTWNGLAMTSVDPGLSTAFTALKADTTSRGINVKYPPAPLVAAVGDGTTDDKAAIQATINQISAQGGGIVLLAGKNFLISSALSVPSNVVIKGLGMGYTALVTSTNTFNAIEITSDARHVVLEDFSITSSGGIGASNAGIKIHDVGGCCELLIRNMNINNFYYGIKFKELFWNSTVENVRFNSCGYSVYGNGSGGQCLNVLFNRCYSNEPTIMGVYFEAVKTFVFMNCNFGGHPTNTTRYILLASVCFGIEIIGCNFENAIIGANEGGIKVQSNSRAAIKGCTFVSNEGVSASAYEVMAQDTSIVTLENNFQNSPGVNIRQVCVKNTAVIINSDNTLNDIVHLTGSTASSKVIAPASARIITSVTKLDLSGPAQELVVLPSSVAGRITKIKFIYTEASSVDAGVNISVTSANGTYTYYSGTSEISKAKWYTFTATLGTTELTASPVIASCVGGKIGTGEILVVIEYVLDN